MFGDLKSHLAIIIKGFLFLLTGLMATGILIAERPELRTILLHRRKEQKSGTKRDPEAVDQSLEM